MYRAVDPTIGLWFAVKHLKNEGDASVKAFKRELEALRRFRHPHIIRIYGVCGAAAGREMYLAFEYAAHGSVEDWLADDRQASMWPFGRRVQTATGVAQALNYMYRATGQVCLHRDVKSANIVLCQGACSFVARAAVRRAWAFGCPVLPDVRPLTSFADGA